MGTYVGLVYIKNGKVDGEPPVLGPDKWSGRNDLLNLCYEDSTVKEILVPDIVDWHERYYRPVDFNRWRERIAKFEYNGERFLEMVDAMETDETLWVGTM